MREQSSSCLYVVAGLPLARAPSRMIQAVRCYSRFERRQRAQQGLSWQHTVEARPLNMHKSWRVSRAV